MTITNYADLQTTVADFLNREDLTDQIATFIQLAEVSMNEQLQHWKMEKRSVATITGQYSDLPPDWLETVRFGVKGKQPFELLDYRSLAEKRAANSAAGDPCYYTHTAGELEIYPTPSVATDVELVYFAAIPTLSDTNTSNWALDAYPNLYIYGALVHSAPFLQEDERLTTWGGLFKDAIDSLNKQSGRARWSGSGLARRVG